MNDEIKIRRLMPRDDQRLFKQIALIHITEIHPGVLPMLGEKFMSRLYLELVRSPRTHVWYAIQEKQVLGFICGCANVSHTYISVLSRAILVLFWYALPALMSNLLWSKIFQLLFYPLKSGKENGFSKKTSSQNNGAQLLSIAITGNAAGHGIGKRLVKALESSFIEWESKGVYYVTTWLGVSESNNFYQSIGFTACGIFQLHDMVLQRYKKAIPEKVENNTDFPVHFGGKNE